MSAQEEIPKINNELEQARRDFNETLMQVNEKVEETEKRLSPEEIIKRRPLIASCCAAATGFALAGSRAGSATAAFVLGALLVLMLKSSSNGVHRT
jgi:hypothetical protein